MSDLNKRIDHMERNEIPLHDHPEWWKEKPFWFVCSNCRRWDVPLNQENGFYFGNDKEIAKFWSWHTYEFTRCVDCKILNAS